jgi:hypothetical protein
LATAQLLIDSVNIEAQLRGKPVENADERGPMGFTRR